jgi:hypothetical protein
LSKIPIFSSILSQNFKDLVAMATIVAMVSSSTANQQPFCSSWTRGSIPISNLTSSLSFKSRLTSLNPQFRAALVEAKPAPLSTQPKDDSLKVLALPVDRADDIQTETKALARAVNASVYSPQLVASRYGSKPFKVLFFFFQSFNLFVNIFCGFALFL